MKLKKYNNYQIEDGLNGPGMRYIWSTCDCCKHRDCVDLMDFLSYDDDSIRPTLWLRDGYHGSIYRFNHDTEANIFQLIDVYSRETAS